MEWPDRDTLIIWLTNAAIYLFLFITSIGICRFLRRQFKTRVNCWFCNKNSWVPYTERNQWTCKGCEQYNGFKKDGDYNKELRAQYSPKYNKSYTRGTAAHISSSPANHLCDSCNRNQELKVHQLATFTAADENNFDQEIEAYKEHLEEAYRLCPGCERIVKRKLNQAKTLILGLKRAGGRNRSGEKKEKLKEGIVELIRRRMSQLLVLSVVVLLGQYFISSRLILLVKGLVVGIDDLATLWSFWDDAGFDAMGYRLALGIMVVVLLGKGAPMNGVEYLSVFSLCALHFLIREGMLKPWEFYHLISEYMIIIEWTLRITALFATIAIFIESLRRSPTSSIKLNDSFHKIDLDDEEEETERDTSSISYTYDKRDTLYRATDFASVFEYNNLAPSTTEDEEIRSISLNSTRRSFHNQSDPLIRPPPFGSEVDWSEKRSPPRPSVSTMHLHSPLKLFPDDRFSNSIQSMKIGGEYHQIKSPQPQSNPFLKNIPLSGSNSMLFSSNNTMRGSNRSLLTPSRLSLVSGNSAFTSAESKNNSCWAATGFWNNQYPNVFTTRTPSTTSFLYAASPKNSLGAHSLDHGLNHERFVPLTESRSSSQSSGFESRQSTSSCQIPAFSPIGSLNLSQSGLGGQESLFNDAASSASVFSVPWSEKGSLPRTPTWSPANTMAMGSFFQPDVFPR